MMPVKKSQNWLPSMFNDFFGNEWLEKATKSAPAVNIIETDEAYKVEIAAPGMTKEDFRINIQDDNELVVTMEHTQEREDKEEKGTYLRREFAFNQFTQRMILPDNVNQDQIDARVDNGVLTIEIPKKKAEEMAPATRPVEVH